MRSPTPLSPMPKLTFSNYEGREHAYIKHYLLAQYLSRWGYKIGSRWDPLVFIDGFAGPWGAKDEEFTDASFGIAIRAMNEAVGVLATLQRTIHGVCIFVEKESKPFARLEAFARKHSSESVRAIALRGRFIDRVQDIDHYIATVGSDPFKLVFLDQKGWASTPMEKLKPFVASRPCELLFNVMTSFLTRFVDRDELAQSYDSFFGRHGVIDKVRALPKGTGQREQAAVDEYCESLRQVCGFRYVSQSVIMDAAKEKIRYFFVFATNSVHGIEVFKGAEARASEAQDEVRHDTKLKKQSQFGLPFGGPAPKTAKMLTLHKQYVERTRSRVINRLCNTRIPISYDDLYGVAMIFPLVTRSDLDRILQELEPYVRVELLGINRKRAGLFKGDRVSVIDRNTLRKNFSAT